MNRRTFLSFGVVGVSATGGCNFVPPRSERGPLNEDDLPTDPAPDDGYPPEFDQVPSPRSFDSNSFEELEYEGVSVPLVPIQVVYNWYVRRRARFVDARSRSEYLRSQIYGAVWSPAPDGGRPDPVKLWPKDDEIVCYCGCPHTLSTIRAATLISEGYESVYVLDEGFWAWYDKGYPIAGNRVDRKPALRVIHGQTDPVHAGKTAQVIHVPTGQREAAMIATDGSYTLRLRFDRITNRSMLAVRTPNYNIVAPVFELIRTTVRKETNGRTRQA